MRILFLGNNRPGWLVLQWLREQGENVVGLVLQSEPKRKFGNELLQVARLDAGCIFDGSTLRNPATLKAIRALQPDIAISVYFGHILKREFLDLFKQGCLNVHPALLPWNRGAYPNVWSIIEGTPAGVTIHYVDDGVDTGDIITQREVMVEPVDTGASLYRKLEDESVRLFVESWRQIKHGQIRRIPQQKLTGSSHRVADVGRIDEIDLDRHYTARDLINILRARSFPPHTGSYFIHRGRKVFMSLSLEFDTE